MNRGLAAGRVRDEPRPARQIGQGSISIAPGVSAGRFFRNYPGFRRGECGKRGLRSFDDSPRKYPGDMLMKNKFKTGDHVSWNSEAGRVSGTIVRIHTRNFEVNGYTRHASAEAPQYEIKSSKTEHVAFHKGSALTKLRD